MTIRLDAGAAKFHMKVICPVKPHGSEKYSDFQKWQSGLKAQPPRPTQAAYRDHHGHWTGCGGRGRRSACDAMTGRIALGEFVGGVRDDGAFRAP
jgi:hypothetical protein